MADRASVSLSSTAVGKPVDLLTSEIVCTSEKVMVSLEIAMSGPADDLVQPEHSCPATKPGTAVTMKARPHASHICAVMVGSGSGALVLEIYS